MGLDLTGNKLYSTSIGTKGEVIKQIATDGLVFHVDAGNKNSYPGSGTSWVNLINSNTGILTNGPTFNTSNLGSISLDGTNDYISSFGNAIVPAGSSPYTVSVWVYRNRSNVGYEELLAQWTYANSGNSFYFGFNSGDVRFSDSWSNVTVSGASNTGVWMNLVGVNTGSNAYIYLNGILSATKGSALTYTGTANFLIGRQGELDGEYFGGKISNVFVYNRALSTTEVMQNYNAQKSRFGL